MNKKVYIESFYRKNKLNFIMAVIGTLCASLLSVGLAIVLQKITDVIMTGSLNDIFHLLVSSSVFILFLLVVQLVVRYFKNKFLTKAVVQYRGKVFENIMNKNINAFSTENTSDYISALTNDITSIENNYLAVLFELITYMVYFLGASICMLFYSVSMTLFAIIVSFSPIFVSVFLGSRVQKAEENLSDNNAKFVNTIQDMLHGFTVLKSFRAESYFLKNYKTTNKEVGVAKYNRNMVAELIGILSQTIGGAIQLGIFLFGAFLAINGKMTAGSVIAVVQLMNYILSPIEKIPQIFSTRKAAENLIDKMVELLDRNSVEDGDIVIERINKELSLENISFKYEEEDVLQNISLNFQQGKSYAIVGASGSGKSTLLNILSGRIDSYFGKIMIDGINSKMIKKECMFDMFSMIEQKVYIFDDTIYNNISLYQSIDKDIMNAVIHKANLSQLILDRGADYNCGENGNKLSGGEKQRISIARSMLRNASIFLLDEATSALDNKNANQITEEILGIDDAIKIVVTHKLSSNLLNKFDEIIVLQNGQVKEQGSFTELMDKKEYFYAMFTLEQAVV